MRANKQHSVFIGYRAPSLVPIAAIIVVDAFLVESFG